ncbi:ABC transporter ATP-binding protein [Rhizobium sp. 2YAF20]|uniref:ABC transporter ATP-binding protein n=1 Tax=Rhizobium sp. 2YAF20 TaxID=3233027 RepID=UPI003F9E1B37
MSGVSVRQIRKSFGAIDILKSVDLEVKPGEFTILLGPSGCGKSTLLNLIAGLDKPDGGQIIIADRDMTDVEPSHRGLAMVFQSYALFPTMSVRQNLSFGLRINKVAKGEIERRVAWVAGLLQIEPLLDRKPSQLSGGQRQRVAIGRALVRSSSICLFDEPLSNLDAKLRAETRIELKRLHAELGSTMIYVTHDQVEAMTMADRVAVMRGGHIEQYDPPQVVYDRPETLFVAGFLGSPPMNFAEGRLVGPDARKLAFEGFEVDVGGYDFKNRSGGAHDVIMGIRSEDLKPVTSATALHAPRLRAEVQVTEPLGADTLIWMTVGTRRWAMRIPTSEANGIRGAIDISFDTARVSIFDASSERRI